MMEFGGASLLSPSQRPLCQGVVSGSSTLYDTTASGAAACLGMAAGTYIDTASVMWMLERSSGARPNLGGVDTRPPGNPSFPTGGTGRVRGTPRYTLSGSTFSCRALSGPNGRQVMVPVHAEGSHVGGSPPYISPG